MPKAMYKVLLDAPMQAVWAFHEEVEEALRALSPPGVNVRITQADKPATGAMVTMRLSLPPMRWWGGETKWVAKYVEYQPPQGQPPYRKAWFVDEQVQGPFRRWRHTHRFEETVDEGRAKVWAHDLIEYAPPLGPVGLVADKVFLRRQIDAMFAHRQKIMRQRLSRRKPPQMSTNAHG